METIHVNYILSQFTTKLIELQRILRETKEKLSLGSFNGELFSAPGIQLSCYDQPCPMNFAIPGKCCLHGQNKSI